MLDPGPTGFLKCASSDRSSRLPRHSTAVWPPPSSRSRPTKIRFVHAPSHLPRAAVSRRGAAAPGRVHRRGVSPAGNPKRSRSPRRWARQTSRCGHARLIPHLDAGRPIVLLAGVHGGCYELFGNERVRAIRDLKGKTVAIQYFGRRGPRLLSSMLAYVGIDPRQDVKWIARRAPCAMRWRCSSKARPTRSSASPSSRRSCAQKKIGHVIVNTAQDRPWSQYFCCMVAANRDFAQRNPIATKRVLRAILKATDICAADPQRAARYLVGQDLRDRASRSGLR